jgi:hypothetical protein
MVQRPDEARITRGASREEPALCFISDQTKIDGNPISDDRRTPVAPRTKRRESDNG